MIVTIDDPIKALLDQCAKYAKVRERLIDGSPSNRSTEIDYWLEQVDSPMGSPWCAAYVSQMGLQALGAAWPVTRDAYVQDIVDFCTKKGLALLDTPQAGDIMVIWYENLKRYGHIGVVEKVLTGNKFKTWEGNTNEDGSRDGNGVYNKTRPLGPRYKFLRWTDLLTKNPA